MKKKLIAVGILVNLSGVAQAQSSVTVYGEMDIGFIKSTGSAWEVGRGDNNKLGFKGAENLGGGMSAIFNLEMRFEPDTGTVENGNRPLFQGRSIVGLTGAFGTVKLGRDLTAMQDPIFFFEPFGFATVGSLDAITGNYSSTPSENSAGNRFSNGIYYSTPTVGGFQGNVTVASKESVANKAGFAPGELKSNPLSLSGTYSNGPFFAMVGWERNTVEDEFRNISGSYKVGIANLIASYSTVSYAAAGKASEKNLLIGADIDVGTGNVKAGYGQIKPNGGSADKQFSIGYWHNLSKRTHLYTDFSNRKAAIGESVNAFDLGIQHLF